MAEGRSLTCHDCGAKARGLGAIVGKESRWYCDKHRTMRWHMGCDKSAGYLREDRGPVIYTGPLPE